MRLEAISCNREIHGRGAEGGVLFYGALPGTVKAVLKEYTGTVQCLYIDPPFNTGKKFSMRMRIGEAGYRTGKPSIRLDAYDDRWDEAEYMAMMREVLELAHGLLREDGTLFLHVDPRMSAYLRIELDKIFGRDNFLNEIIWAYQTGGRALEHFSRKHDVILFYRKSKAVYFDIKQVPIPREGSRQNHMKRGVDTDGRTYRTIRSAGKEYRYYDDEPTYPGDVWDDVSHLQQKDPQRTGYDTQKPLKLLERIIRCASRPGDLVCDLFFGSGTTLVCAAQEGRRFLGVDASPNAHAVVRKRLAGRDVDIHFPCEETQAIALAQIHSAIGFYEVQLEAFHIPCQPKGMVLDDLDAVDQWAVGFMREGIFYPCAGEARTKQTPALSGRLEIPMLEGERAAEIIDIWGARRFYRIP